MNRDNISFVMPAYNAEATLAAAVDSIIKGNFDEGDEVLIVDDASTDKTSKIVQELADRFPSIKSLRHRYRKGSAAAGRNTAIENSRHGLVFALDADNVLVPGSVARLKTKLRNSQADAAAFQEIHYFSEDVRRVSHKWVFPPGEVTLADALCGHLWPGPSGNYLFTRESWVRAGRYHEFIGGGIDSWAFSIRQLATGSKMVVTPGSYYLHRCGSDTAYVRDEREGGVSLKALQVLLPFLHLIQEGDVEYLFSSEGRHSWYKDLPERPIRLRSGTSGAHGEIIRPPAGPLAARLIRRLESTARRVLKRRE
ncbi:MAG TPA: glycosyltransferase family 2 protein [Methylomirabilota bacterium]|nr:glycosyltransferase family 2 protein [Methylomirabilota bacterium]